MSQSTRSFARMDMSFLRILEAAFTNCLLKTNPRKNRKFDHRPFLSYAGESLIV